MRCPASILEALRLYTSGAWSSLASFAAEMGPATAAGCDEDPAPGPDRRVLALLLQALAHAPLQPCRPADLDPLADLAPEAACWVAMARSHVSIALHRILGGESSTALHDLRAGINRVLATLASLDLHITAAERDQLLAGSQGLLHILSSQQELQIAIRAGSLPRQLIFILGMHRSGTSALSGMLVKAGFAPPHDLMPATEANPLGYWESLTLMQINDRPLNQIGSHWSSVRPLPAGWPSSGMAAQWRLELLHDLGIIFPDHADAVIKDPRFCVLIPGLEPWLQTGLLRISVLMPLRHPMEVARSLQQSEQTPIVQGLQLWLSHTLTAEYSSRPYRRLLVDFQHLINQPTAILEQCLALLGEPDEASRNDGRQETRLQRAAAFIDPQLQRQRVRVDADHRRDPASADTAKAGDPTSPQADASALGPAPAAGPGSDPHQEGTETPWYTLAERVHAVLRDPQLTPCERIERLEPLRRQWAAIAD